MLLTGGRLGQPYVSRCGRIPHPPRRRLRHVLGDKAYAHSHPQVPRQTRIGHTTRNARSESPCSRPRLTRRATTHLRLNLYRHRNTTNAAQPDQTLALIATRSTVLPAYLRRPSCDVTTPLIYQQHLARSRRPAVAQAAELGVAVRRRLRPRAIQPREGRRRVAVRSSNPVVAYHRAKLARRCRPVPCACNVTTSRAWGSSRAGSSPLAWVTGTHIGDDAELPPPPPVCATTGPGWG